MKCDSCTANEAVCDARWGAFDEYELGEALLCMGLITWIGIDQVYK